MKLASSSYELSGFPGLKLVYLVHSLLYVLFFLLLITYARRVVNTIQERIDRLDNRFLLILRFCVKRLIPPTPERFCRFSKVLTSMRTSKGLQVVHLNISVQE